jgi:hypothetical protein
MNASIIMSVMHDLSKIIYNKHDLGRVISRLDLDLETHRALITCSKCKTLASQAALYDAAETEWHLTLTCSPCSNKWHMCLACHCKLATRPGVLSKHFTTLKHTSKFGQPTTPQSMSGVVSLTSQDHPIVIAVDPSSTASTPEVSLPLHLHSLRRLYTHLPEPNDMDFIWAFPLRDNTENSSMRNYFAADHFSEHAGVQYLVTNAFQRGPNYSIPKLATKQEAKWHFGCFVQYMSMTQKQRARQAGIINTNFIDQSSFTNTHIPEQKELNQLYGRSNKTTIWNNLPIPHVENFSGIGYVSPANILRYLFGFSVEMDHFTVQDSQTPGDATFHVNQSSFAMKWRQELQAMHPDKVHLLVWLTHWRDGFGPNRTKNNRKSAVAWTASFSTPKGRINSIDNTRLIALGLKKNEAWPDVEHKFEEDMRLFGNGLKPFMVYHGGLKKIIPVFVRQFACLTDKVERSDITQTLGCTSTIHRQFGQILPIEEAPIVDTKAIQKFLKDMKMGLGKPRQYNWSSSMLSCNGVSEVLPACTICRKNNVDWLRREPSQRDPAIERCENCANWKVSSVTEARLRYAAPPNYPNQSRTMPSLPDGVVVPHGREPSPLLPPTPEGAETPIHYLLPIHCDFKTLRDGTRFCFFNAMAKNTIGWNQEISKSYLRSLGINEAQASLVYKAAQKAYNEKKAAEEAGQEPKDIDWKDPYYVGDYRFPAAWVGDLPIPNYIELLMHLMFLGIASSSFDQCTAFLKEQKKLVPFKKHSNELLKILNGFNLSWLLAYPFGGTKLTTGAWVSENWLAWVRVSTICCAFVGHEGVEDEKKGCNDVLRMVTCLQALVANVMSHAGSTSESTRLVDSLAREFLSAVRELDVRITNGKGSQCVHMD